MTERKNIMREKVNGLDLLSRKQVAEKLGVCTLTIKRMVDHGTLPEVKINQRLIRYRRADLERMIASAIA